MRRSICLALLSLSAAVLDIEAQSVAPEQSATSPPAVETREEKLPPSTPIAFAADWVITLGDLENRISQAIPESTSRAQQPVPIKP